MTLRPIDPSSGQADPVNAKSPSPIRKLTLAAPPEPGTLQVAFASKDRTHVDQHFGAAEGFVLYLADSTHAKLSGVLEFPPESMDGNENKLSEKIDALRGCAAVFCLAVGGSAVRQLVQAGIQPMRLDTAEPVENILHTIICGIRDGGVPWIDKALRAQDGDTARFERMLEEGWQE